MILGILFLLQVAAEGTFFQAHAGTSGALGSLEWGLDMQAHNRDNRGHSEPSQIALNCVKREELITRVTLVLEADPCGTASRLARKLC